MDSWLNMVLLCGLLLIASLQATNASRLRRSKNEKIRDLRPHIENLQRHYNVLGNEWVGKPVFASHLDQLNSKASCTCKTLLLEGMLNAYVELFQDMLNNSEKMEVKNDLTAVVNKVKDLKHKYTEDHKVWKELQDIHSIKAKNGTIQKAALNDFLMVFDKAYSEK